MYIHTATEPTEPNRTEPTDRHVIRALVQSPCPLPPAMRHLQILQPVPAYEYLADDGKFCLRREVGGWVRVVGLFKAIAALVAEVRNVCGSV